jgi:hypothetical protein
MDALVNKNTPKVTKTKPICKPYAAKNASTTLNQIAHIQHKIQAGMKRCRRGNHESDPAKKRRKRLVMSKQDRKRVKIKHTTNTHKLT